VNKSQLGACLTNCHEVKKTVRLLICNLAASQSISECECGPKSGKIENLWSRTYWNIQAGNERQSKFWEVVGEILSRELLSAERHSSLQFSELLGKGQINCCFASRLQWGFPSNHSAVLCSSNNRFCWLFPQLHFFLSFGRAAFRRTKQQAYMTLR
jgi:hypothetical protein